MKHLFYTVGNEPEWNVLPYGNTDKNILIDDIKYHLRNEYQSRWLSVINKSEGRNKTEGNKLRTYSKFKKEFQIEKYLLSTQSKRNRAEYAKLRISAHKLAIEMGRYHRPNKIPADSRFCIFCKDGSIEHEEHFILKCKLYSQERNECFNKLKDILEGFQNFNDLQIFKIIMSADNDIEITKIVVKFVAQCMEKRSNQMGSGQI